MTPGGAIAAPQWTTAPLRQDLRLFPGPPHADGSPTWTLWDPAANRYFRLGWLEHAVLTRWPAASATQLVAAVRHHAGLTVSLERVGEIVGFLVNNQLLGTTDQAAVQTLLRREQAGSGRFGRWLLHHYLFFRIPLVRPDRFLTATLPAVRWLGGASARGGLAVIAVVGLYLTGRQWEAFQHTFPHFFTVPGILWFGGAIIGAKIIHELGHAYTARHFGCRIPTMGVAFMVLWPVLYTDTSAAWRLTSRRARLAIDGAGILAELGLAALATLSWHLLPDGPPRSAAALLAAVTWISTLLINLNPFMRFDGYYLLADFLGIANLQDRAFALGRWRLREALFGFGDPPPERFPARRHRLLLAFAYGTWLYRLFLFVGIALLVYHLAFKLAGIFLLAVELGWFVARPLWREVGDWWQRRARWRWNRHTVATLLVSGGFAALLVVPWPGHITVAALLESQSHVRLYAPTPARIEAVLAVHGDRVRQGAPLLLLNAPDLERDLERVRARIRAVRWEIDQEAVQRAMLARRLVLQETLLTLKAEEGGYREQRERLRLTAPFSGTVVAIRDGLQPGRWVSRTTPLLELVDPHHAEVNAWVAERDVGRVRPGVGAWFYPDHGDGPGVPLTLTHLDPVAAEILDKPAFASRHGGEIPTRPDGVGRLIPDGAVYRLRFRPEGATGPVLRTVMGQVRIPVERRSLIRRALTLAGGVWIRESGF